MSFFSSLVVFSSLLAEMLGSATCNYIEVDSVAGIGAQFESYNALTTALCNSNTLQPGEILVQAENPDLYGNISITQYYDEGDVLIYNETNWVSWLSPSSYAARQSWTDGLNFGGTSDWALDLNETYANNGTGSELSSGLELDFTVCDYSLTFASLADLSTQAGSLRTDCVGAYTLQVLIDMLDTAYTNYTDVNDGYDEMFGYYVTYITKLVPSTLSNEFMFNQSATTQWETVPVLGTGMNYFDCTLGDGTDIPCIKLNTSYTYEETIAEKTTALTLTDSDGYEAALANFGLEADWVTLGDYEKDLDFVAPHASKKFEYKFTGFPNQNDSMVVPSPKDIVTKGLGSIPNLKTSMQATLLDIMMGVWTNGTSSDAALAYSTPVFLLMQAVDEMAQAKALGQQEEKEEEEEAKRKKNFILLIVSVVLMFVPIVGEEVAAAAGMASLARAIAIASEIGNAALGIYDTVDDPSSAVVNIIGMLLGLGAIAKVSRDGQGIASVAKLRRAMTSDEVAAMGSIFKANDDNLQAIMKVCKF